MAKILTWADMPTGITKGSPTNRCPTRSMIEANVQSGYNVLIPNTVSSNQLVTSVSVSQSNYTIKIRVIGTGSSYTDWRCLLTLGSGSTGYLYGPSEWIQDTGIVTVHATPGVLYPFYIGNVQAIKTSTGTIHQVSNYSISITYPNATINGVDGNIRFASSGNMVINITEGISGGGTIIDPGLRPRD